MPRKHDSVEESTQQYKAGWMTTCRLSREGFPVKKQSYIH